MERLGPCFSPEILCSFQLIVLDCNCSKWSAHFHASRSISCSCLTGAIGKAGKKIKSQLRNLVLIAGQPSHWKRSQVRWNPTPQLVAPKWWLSSISAKDLGCCPLPLWHTSCICCNLSTHCYLSIHCFPERTTWFELQFSSVAQLCPTLCDPMDCSNPGLPVHHQLPEFTQTHVHRVGDAIQPSHPPSSPSSLSLGMVSTYLSLPGFRCRIQYGPHEFLIGICWINVALWGCFNTQLLLWNLIDERLSEGYLVQSG